MCVCVCVRVFAYVTAICVRTAYVYMCMFLCEYTTGDLHVSKGIHTSHKRPLERERWFCWERTSSLRRLVWVSVFKIGLILFKHIWCSCWLRNDPVCRQGKTFQHVQHECAQITLLFTLKISAAAITSHGKRPCEQIWILNWQRYWSFNIYYTIWSFVVKDS